MLTHYKTLREYKIYHFDPKTDMTSLLTSEFLRPENRFLCETTKHWIWENRPKYDTCHIAFGLF